MLWISSVKALRTKLLTVEVYNNIRKWAVFMSYLIVHSFCNLCHRKLTPPLWQGNDPVECHFSITCWLNLPHINHRSYKMTVKKNWRFEEDDIEANSPILYATVKAKGSWAVEWCRLPPPESQSLWNSYLRSSQKGLARSDVGCEGLPTKSTSSLIECPLTS